MIRLMAFDLDGTILNAESLIEPPVRAAVARARAAGIIVTIATGRMFQSARRFAQELELGSVPLILYNGALLQDNGDATIYRHHPLPHELAREIGGFLAARGVHVNIYYGDELYVSDRNAITEQYARRIGVTARLEPGILTEMPWAPTKLLVVAEPDEIPPLAADLRALVGERVSLASSTRRFLEITDCGINKGNALAELAAMLGIDREQVLAAGDGQNDVEMIAYAGVGVAAHGAFPEVLRVADVFAGPGPAGLAEIINRAADGLPLGQSGA